MKNQLKLEVAQNPICLNVSDPHCLDQIAESYQGFFSDRKPKVEIEIHITHEMHHSPSTDGVVTSDGPVIRISDTSFWGTVDLDKGKGKLEVMPEWLALSLKIFLRYVFALLHLLSGDGLILHGLGVLKAGQVYVFFGPSGSGKTTAATLSEGHTILSDDVVFLRPETGSFWVHPTPPWGDMQRGERENRPYPLKAVFKLKKAEEIGITQCNRVQAISDVITFPPMSTDIIRADKLLPRFLQLVKGVPFYELRFVRNRSFWPCIDTSLYKTGTKNAKRYTHGQRDTH